MDISPFEPRFIQNLEHQMRLQLKKGSIPQDASRFIHLRT